MPGRASVLQSSVAMGESGPVMVLSGEADAHAAAQLRELLVAQLFRGQRRLVIDVAGLRHIDSESVRVLVVAAKMLRERHGELVLLHPQPTVARMLELMGADQAITMSEAPRTVTAPMRPR
jgi:anti-anti-sigma factor